MNAGDVYEWLTQAADVQSYARAWLDLQHTMIVDMVTGVVVMDTAQGSGFTPVAQWSSGQGRAEHLSEISERVLAKKEGLLVELPVESGAHYAIGYPILVNGVLHGVAALGIHADSPDQLKATMTQLQWAVGGLELWCYKQAAVENESVHSRLKSAIDLLTVVLAESEFEGASLAFVTELATLIKCDRVSLGFMHQDKIRVQAVSHSAQIGNRMNLNRRIALSMEEAIVQRSEISYPAPVDHTLVTREHEQLAAQNQQETILTLPLYGNDVYYGALTLERPGTLPFDDDEVALCRNLVSLAGPVLEEKRRNSRLLVYKIFDAAHLQVSRLIGPRYWGWKFVVLAMILVSIWGWSSTDDYVTADVALEGAVLRAVAAPFDGFVKQASVRAGDTVEDQDVLCILDDRDLKLEVRRWQSQKAQLQKQLEEAMAKYDRVILNVTQARLQQVEAQLDLAHENLRRASIRAPYAGVVISGDLSQRLGGAVDRGEVLFEVAPLADYRIILSVDERRISGVNEGQRGRLVLSALPEDELSFVVEKITPIAIAKDGRNTFRVEARLDSHLALLRPGMEGIGKIRVGRAQRITLWTRDLAAWWRLKIWSWWT